MRSTWEELVEYAEFLGFTLEEIEEILSNVNREE